MSKDYDDGFNDGLLFGMAMGDDDHEGKDACYIATSVYGSYDCPEVWVLRRFRDGQLKPRVLGRAFVRLYYAVSPSLVRWFGSVDWIRSMTRKPLDKLVAHLQNEGVSNEPYADRQISQPKKCQKKNQKIQINELRNN